MFNIKKRTYYNVTKDSSDGIFKKGYGFYIDTYTKKLIIEDDATDFLIKYTPEQYKNFAMDFDAEENTNLMLLSTTYSSDNWVPKGSIKVEVVDVENDNVD